MCLAKVFNLQFGCLNRDWAELFQSRFDTVNPFNLVMSMNAVLLATNFYIVANTKVDPHQYLY